MRLCAETEKKAVCREGEKAVCRDGEKGCVPIASYKKKEGGCVPKGGCVPEAVCQKEAVCLLKL